FIAVILWHNISSDVHWIFGLYEIVPGFVICLLFSVIVSALDKNKNSEMLAEFDNYKKMSD
ncbi:MAG: sodium:proline symporter, partial [Treponema sp.]|nr:sodium:proline symporter [Treponema sp.]